jgi:hypothetical protein
VVVVLEKETRDERREGKRRKEKRRKGKKRKEKRVVVYISIYSWAEVPVRALSPS